MGCGASSLPTVNTRFVDLTHFSVERVLGKGGFGKVHAVRKIVEPHKGEWFALKTLTKASILSTKGGIDAVMTELHALVNLSHPFICNIHYAFQDRCCLFLIIDLALGGDLRYHLRHAPGNRFSEERCKFYIAQLLLALDFVHSRNFLHRDIKPDNILMHESGYIKLTDFGVSKHLEDVNNCNFTSGTHGYMAPEIYLDKHIHGVPSEWFSLGVCLHEMAVGKRPWSGSKLQEKSISSLEEAETLMSLTMLDRADVSDECKSIIRGLLAVDQKKRLGTKAVEDIFEHPWFSGFEWDELKAKTMQPPFVPDISQANFDTGELDIAEAFGEVDEEDFKSIPDEEQVKFVRYHYNSASAPGAEGAEQIDLSEFQREGHGDNFEDAVLPRDTLAGPGPLGFVQTDEDPWAAERASVAMLHPNGPRRSAVRFDD